MSNIDAISVLDGRYIELLQQLKPLVSEFSLIKYRVLVEVKWLLFLSSNVIKHIDIINSEEEKDLLLFVDDFDNIQGELVKGREYILKHDVKAVEYYIRDYLLQHSSLSRFANYVHFCCTSEDINNVAYALMLSDVRSKLLLPLLNELTDKIYHMSVDNSAVVMMSRTHGQSATPTTIGKELYNFYYRLLRQLSLFTEQPIMAKFNGAVGNYNAHYIAYPELDWVQLSQNFIESFRLDFNPYSTQIEPHDYIIEYFHIINRMNSILIGLSRDMWAYISLNYFVQLVVKDEVGSSTMPHKVNPIDFENAEGNFGLANSMIDFFANKLLISRWQRDLSDSTVLRNIGSIIGYVVIACKSLLKGLSKVAVNKHKMLEELDSNWSLLAEPIQTVMRKFDISNSYELLKEFTRGKDINKELIHEFILSSKLPDNVIEQLLQLAPDNYTGLADKLVQMELR